MAVIDDTWTWRQLAPATPPDGRFCSAMVWDGSRVLLFGGLKVGTGGGLLGDTWELVGDEWNQLSPLTSPSARYLHQAVWDGTRMLIMGGNDNSGELDETWEYVGGDWNQLTVSPIKDNGFNFVIGHNMVWDGSRVIAVIPGSPDHISSGMVTFEFTAGDWSQVAPVAEYDSGFDGMKWYPASAWASDRMVTSGGEIEVGPFVGLYNDTDEYAANTWARTVNDSAPGIFDQRSQHRMIWTDDAVFLFAGKIDIGTQACTSDTWVYDKATSTWTEIFPQGAPPEDPAGRVGRRDFGMVWDGARVIVFSGAVTTVGGNSLGDTWVLEPPTLASISHRFGLQ